MNKIYALLMDNPLFSGIEFDEFERMLRCLDARAQSYKKEEIILRLGDRISFVGVILTGGVKILKEDVNGNTAILTELGSSEIFGEVFACAEIEHSPVTVQVTEQCEVLLINYRKIITICPSACRFHGRLIENMLRLIAKKTLMLNQKIEILSKRTTREKLLLFFDTQRGNANQFTIPYNREEMARYLCVDRSAMSNELGKMRDEGLIRFKKNNFEIL